MSCSSCMRGVTVSAPVVYRGGANYAAPPPALMALARRPGGLGYSSQPQPFFGLGMTSGQRNGLIVAGLLLAAGGLAYAFRAKPVRYRRRRHARSF